MSNRFTPGCCCGCKASVFRSLADPESAEYAATFEYHVAGDGERRWRIRSAVRSNDIEFRVAYALAGYVPGDEQNHDISFALVDSLGEDLFRLRFSGARSVDYGAGLVDLPDFVSLPAAQLRYYEVEVFGPGVPSSTFRVVARRSGPLGFYVSFYDDSVSIAPTYTAAARPPSLPIIPTSDQSLPTDYFFVWKDDGSYNSSSPRFVLPRDATAAAPVHAEIRTSTASVLPSSFGFLETELFTSIGYDRPPYDPDLVDSSKVLGCPDAVKNCQLIGTEENLRLEAAVDWGPYSFVKPLKALPCVANTLQPFVAGDLIGGESQFFFRARLQAGLSGAYSATGYGPGIAFKSLEDFVFVDKGSSIESTTGVDVMEWPLLQVDFIVYLERLGNGNIGIKVSCSLVYRIILHGSGYGDDSPLVIFLSHSFGLAVDDGGRLYFMDETVGSGDDAADDPCSLYSAGAIRKFTGKPSLPDLVYYLGLQPQTATVKWSRDLGVSSLAELGSLPDLAFTYGEADSTTAFNDYVNRISSVSGPVVSSTSGQTQDPAYCNINGSSHFAAGGVIRGQIALSHQYVVEFEKLLLSDFAFTLRPQSLRFGLYN